MKRYLLLYGDIYYPEGLDDLVGVFETLEECKDLVREKATKQYNDNYYSDIHVTVEKFFESLRWAEVLDLQTLVKFEISL